MTSTTETTDASAAAGRESSEEHSRLLLMLDLSTAHLPQELAEDLSGCAGVIAHELAAGWLLYVPEQLADEDDVEPPAEVLADLPTWDW